MPEHRINFETAVLARQKGFDEVCRHVFIRLGEKIVPIDPPPDTQMMANVRGIIVKYLNDLPGLLKALGDKDPEPLHNSRLPENTYARPTLDVMEEWLSEVHGIHVYAKILLGDKEKEIPPLYVAGVYTTKWSKSAEKLQDNKAFEKRSDARETAIQMGLLNLKDA